MTMSFRPWRSACPIPGPSDWIASPPLCPPNLLRHLCVAYLPACAGARAAGGRPSSDMQPSFRPAMAVRAQDGRALAQFFFGAKVAQQVRPLPVAPAATPAGSAAAATPQGVLPEVTGMWWRRAASAPPPRLVAESQVAQEAPTTNAQARAQEGVGVEAEVPQQGTRAGPGTTPVAGT